MMQEIKFNIPPDDFNKEAKNLIANGKLEEALDYSKQFAEGLNNEKSFNQVLMLTARFNDWEKKKMQGVMDPEQEEVEINRIRKTLLDSIDDLSRTQESLTNQTTKESFSKTEQIPDIEIFEDNVQKQSAQQEFSSDFVQKSSENFKETESLEEKPEPEEEEEEEEPTVVIEFGDMFTAAEYDAFVIPRDNLGFFSNSFQQSLKKLDVSLDRQIVSKLGDTELEEYSEGNGHFFILYVTTWENGKSSIGMMKNIGHSIGFITTDAENRIRKVVAPLLGTGAGGLDEKRAFEHLKEGFLASADSGSQLTIYIRNPEYYKTLTGKEAPTTAVDREELSNRIDLAYQTKTPQTIVRAKNLHFSGVFDQYDKYRNFEAPEEGFFKETQRALEIYNNNFREAMTQLDRKSTQNIFISQVNYLAANIESNLFDDEDEDYDTKRQRWKMDLVLMKAEEEKTIAISKGLMYAIAYLENPATFLPVLSEKYRKRISKYILGKEYERASFEQEIFDFLYDFEFELQNPENRGALFAAILFDKPVKELWDKEDNRTGKDSDISIGEVALGSSLAGYNADTLDGEDQLDILPDVRAFARLMASKDMKPPLSIGVFGNWGSGKSFFMKQIEKEVDKIVQGIKRKKKEDETQTFGFYDDIVQITFNAWYYIDANLWASLVTHIFEKLSAAVGNKTEEEKREILAKKRLEEAIEQQELIQSEIIAAEKRKAEIEAELKKPAAEGKRKSQLKLEQIAQNLIIQKAEDRIKRVIENKQLITGKLDGYEQRRIQLKEEIEKLEATLSPSQTKQERKKALEKLHRLKVREKTLMSNKGQHLISLYNKLQKLDDEIRKAKDKGGEIPESLLKEKSELRKQIRIEELEDEQKRAQLYEDLATTSQLVEEAEAEKREAIEATEEIRDEIAKIEKASIQKQREIRKTAINFVIDQVKGDETFKGFISKIEENFNTKIDTEKIEDIRGVLNEYEGNRHRWLSIYNFLMNLKWDTWIVLVALMILPPLLIYLGDLIDWEVLNTWVTKVAAFTSSTVLFFWKLSQPLKQAFQKINDGIGYVEKAREKLSEYEKRKNAQIEVLKQEYEKLIERQKEAKQRLQKAQERVAQARKEIVEINKGKRLASFIERRLSSNDYQKHLGLISLIRQDFDKLSQYLQQRIEELQDDRKIDRIVLYIDDLDRCPPEKVVEVLQAIHLLLAFPLFVVVVGVDVRWISRSLMKRYGDMLSRYQPTTKEGGTQKPTKLSKSLRGSATPFDYLEKIFQIPFKIKPLADNDKEQYLSKLLEGEIEEEIGEDTVVIDEIRTEETLIANEPQKALAAAPEEAPKVVATVGNTNIEAPPVLEEEIETVESETPENGSTEEETEVEQEQESISELSLDMPLVKFKRMEVDFIKAIAPILGDSPRTIKRFLNVYRLIKSNDKLREKGTLDNYQELLVLLTIIAAAPAISQQFFHLLMNDYKTQNITLRAFIQNLKKQHFQTEQSNPDYHEKVNQELRDLNNFIDYEPKDKDEEKAKAKEKVVEQILNIKLDELRELVPVVSRFSFRTIDV